MFKIDLEAIHPLEIEYMCTSERAYRRGEQYFFDEKVSHIQYIPAEKKVSAVVKGSRNYQTTISFDSSGEPKRFFCTCEGSETYAGACKHVAATMLEIYERSSQLHYNQNRGGITSHDMIDAFKGAFRTRSSLVRETRERLKIYYELTFSSGYFSHTVEHIEIRLRAGVQRPYVVRDIHEFLFSLEKDLPYTFTPNFVYDPEHHLVAKEDLEILQHLIKIEEIKQTTLSRRSFIGPDTKEPRLVIPDVWFPEFLVLLEGAEHLSYRVGGSDLTPLFISDLEPRSFTFLLEQSSSDRSAVLRLENVEDYVFFLPEHRAVVRGQDLFVLTEEQAVILHMLQSDSGKKDQISRFSTSQLEGFCSYVLPKLEQVGQVLIDPSLKELIQQYPLYARLELDLQGDTLYGQLVFQYGEAELNPLARAQNEGREQILVRDVEQEELILTLLAQTPMLQTEEGYALDGEEEIVQMLFEHLPLLEKYMDIYSTSAVRSLIAPVDTPPSVRLETNEQMNWLELSFSVDGIPEEEIDQLLHALRRKQTFYRLSTGAFVHLEGELFADLRHAVKQLVPDKEKLARSMSVPLYKALALEEYNTQAYKVSESLKKLIEDLRNPDRIEYALPKGLKAELRPYQIIGYKWLRTLAQFGLGGILADDMGLGKTLQTITFLQAMYEQNPQMCALVLAPASLLYNWKREIERFAPELQVVVVAGTKEERVQLLSKYRNQDVYQDTNQNINQNINLDLNQDASLDTNLAIDPSSLALNLITNSDIKANPDLNIRNIAPAQVLITSYPLIQRDAALYQDVFVDALFLDEAQAIKNDASKTSKAVRQLRSKCTFALSGTPIENRLEELYAIVHTLMPGLLGAKKSFRALEQAEIAKRVRPFILRRMKKDVLKELPEKIEQVQYTDLTEEQKKLYLAQVRRLARDVETVAAENRFQESRFQILSGLTRLRQICCHPQLILPQEEHSSGKFERLLEIVEDGLESGQRMVIFSQFTSMLALIRQAFDQRNWLYHYLDGSTPVQERVDLAERFNAGEHSLFLISMKAGGTGLNLTGGDTVILFDTWWNPAVEEQAADRVYRFGQKKTVQVIKLITTGTIEEKMLALHEKKKALVEEIIQPGEQSLTSMTLEEIKELLQV